MEANIGTRARTDEPPWSSWLPGADGACRAVVTKGHWAGLRLGDTISRSRISKRRSMSESGDRFEGLDLIWIQERYAVEGIPAPTS